MKGRNVALSLCRNELRACSRLRGDGIMVPRTLSGDVGSHCNLRCFSIARTPVRRTSIPASGRFFRYELSREVARPLCQQRAFSRHWGPTRTCNAVCRVQSPLARSSMWDDQAAHHGGYSGFSILSCEQGIGREGLLP